MFEIELIIYIKMDLALNNLQRLICHKTQPTNFVLWAGEFLFLCRGCSQHILSPADRVLLRAKIPPPRPQQKVCPKYDTKPHLIVRLQFWSSRKFGAPLHCHNAQVHSYLEWQYELGSHLWVQWISLKIISVT